MRVTERIALIGQIARVLAGKNYTLREMDTFLEAFGLSSPVSWGNNPDKEYYAKAGLLSADDKIIERIIEDLQLDLPRAALGVLPPLAWKDTTDFKLFISHISANKDKATRLKEALKAHHIAGFIAHQDIEPTKPWQMQIERALWTMDAMVAVHTTGFKDSTWTQQEVGFALGRDVYLISLKMEREDPTGMISKDQALSRGRRSAEEVAKEIAELLRKEPRTAQRLADAEFFGDDEFLKATAS